MKKYSKASSGFTLVEMAIVMVIVALMLGGLMMSLSQTTENTRRSDARTQLDGIVEALYGYAQANGRLPCPATPATNGAESPVGGGACSLQHGFVPSATLGLSGAVNGDGLLLDPWNTPYRYSVTTANSNAFTTVGGMQAATMAGLSPNLRVCREAACSNPIATTLPVVIICVGKNWANFTSANEIANAGEATVGGGPTGLVYRVANNRDFVSAGYNQSTFDDLISWLSPNILYTKMIAAGKLP